MGDANAQTDQSLSLYYTTIQGSLSQSLKSCAQVTPGVIMVIRAANQRITVLFVREGQQILVESFFLEKDPGLKGRQTANKIMGLLGGKTMVAGRL